MTRKLYYLDVKGFGEAIRYLLHYGELDFEDVRIKPEEFAKFKESGIAPFGKVPVYMEGDRTLNQSLAIARYIGRQLDLVPTDPWQEASLDAVIQTYNDLQPHVKAFLTEQDETIKEIFKQKMLEQADFYFSQFDKQLADNNGYFGKTLSWVDIVFVGLLDAMKDYMDVNLEKFTNIQALIITVQSLSGIKEYIEKRDQKTV